MNTIQNQLTTVSVLLLALILSPAVPSAAGQNGSTSGPEYPARLSPAMAIIIVVLVAALFFMAFFSIYIRRCSNANSGGTIRPILSIRRRAAAARGLDAQVIETFPTFPYSEVKGLQIGKGALECAVCLNEFEDDETLRLIPKCDHVFHPECIDAWLESHVTCPVCRANLVPEDGDVSVPENINNVEQQNNQENGDVLVPISDDIETNRPNNNNTTTEETLPEVIINRSASTKQNQNRPPRSRSVRPRLFERFRSHSTGHSLVQAGQNVDRFTLRLLPEVRKEVMKRALLNRTASSVVVRGYRTGEGSSRGKSIRRLESLDEPVKSDRWGFSRVPSFLSRAFSVRSPKVAAAAVANGEASTSSMIPAGPMSSDGPGPVTTESVRPPV